MMIQLSCCSSNIDYAPDHANLLTVLCMYACNFLKEQISIIFVACVSNIFVQDTAEGTAIDRSSNGLYNG